MKKAPANYSMMGRFFQLQQLNWVRFYSMLRRNWKQLSVNAFVTISVKVEILAWMTKTLCPHQHGFLLPVVSTPFSSVQPSPTLLRFNLRVPMSRTGLVRHSQPQRHTCKEAPSDEKWPVGGKALYLWKNRKKEENKNTGNDRVRIT